MCYQWIELNINQCNRAQNQNRPTQLIFFEDAKEIQWRIDFSTTVLKQLCIHKQNHYLSLNLTS